MIEIKCNNIESLKSMISDYSMDKKNFKKYYLKQVGSVFIGNVLFISMFLAGNIFFNLKIPINNALFGIALGNYASLGVVDKNLKIKLNKLTNAVNCVHELTFKLQKTNVYAKMAGFKNQNLLFCDTKIIDGDVDKTVYEDLAFYDIENKLRILRQIKKYSNQKLVLNKIGLLDEKEYDNEKIEHYKKIKSFSLKSNKFVEGENEDYY